MNPLQDTAGASPRVKGLTPADSLRLTLATTPSLGL